MVFLNTKERQKKYEELIPKAKLNNADAFDKILDLLDPLIKKRVNYYSRKSNISKEVMEIDAISQIQNAIKNYSMSNSSKNFESYARSYIDKIRRTAYEHANIGYIPEHRIIKVNTFNKVKDKLSKRFGRMPSNFELSDELGWSTKEVDRMTKELKTELVDNADVGNIQTLRSTETNDMLHYIRYELQPNEQVIYDRLVGIGYNPMSPQKIAKDLKIKEQYVYNIKKKISKKISPFITKG